MVLSQDVGVLSWIAGTVKITSPRSLTDSRCVLRSSLKYVLPFASPLLLMPDIFLTH